MNGREEDEVAVEVLKDRIRYADLIVDKWLEWAQQWEVELGAYTDPRATTAHRMGLEIKAALKRG